MHGGHGHEATGLIGARLGALVVSFFLPLRPRTVRETLLTRLPLLVGTVVAGVILGIVDGDLASGLWFGVMFGLVLVVVPTAAQAARLHRRAPQ